jgi:hypothetical protein
MHPKLPNIAPPTSPSSGTPGEGKGGGFLKRGVRRGGFTFLEVLFAVIVLGVGFIMVAAMFPAAIHQTRAAVEDTTAISVWGGLERRFQSLAKDIAPNSPAPPAKPLYALDQYMRPGTSIPAVNQNPTYRPVVYSFNDSRVALAPGQNYDLLWDYVAANFIQDADPRYGVVPMFTRVGDVDANNNPIWSSQVQLYLVTVRSRNQTQYSNRDLVITKNGSKVTMAVLQPTLFQVQVNPSAGVGLPPYIDFLAQYDAGGTFTAGNAKPGGINGENSPLGVGAYIIISDDGNKGRNGTIYRLGARVNASNPDSYFIAPDVQGSSDVYDVKFTKAYKADAFIVGRGFNNNVAAFDGPVQDIGIGVVPITLQQ